MTESGSEPGAWLREVGRALKTAELDDHLGREHAALVVASLRSSIESPDDPESLSADELADARADPRTIVDAALAMEHWGARFDPSVFRAFLRSELEYGPVVTREHSPYVLRIASADGAPIGVESSERLWGLTAMIEARCEQDGLVCRVQMAIPTPYVEVSAQHDETGTVRYEQLVRMCETGSDDEKIVEALAACRFDDRTALFVLRDGIEPPLAEGML